MLRVFLMFLLMFPAIYWRLIKDLAIRKRMGVHMYGIFGYFGLPGQGKTISMCRELINLRKKHGDKILITTNFGFKDEDFPFTDWHELLHQRDRPLVVAWDEVQNEFNSRKFKDFPTGLMTQLTQVRKNNGIRILYTSQRFGFVDKNFRDLSFAIYDCRTWLGCFTVLRKFDPKDYEDRLSRNRVDDKFKVKPMLTTCFLQTDKLRNCYDSYKMLETAKNKEYMTRAELAALRNGNEQG